MSDIRIQMNSVSGWSWCADKTCPVFFFAENNKICPGCWQPGLFSVEKLSYVLKEKE